MKKLILPVLGLAVLAFATPAVAGGCNWSKQQQTEKPQEKVENPSA